MRKVDGGRIHTLSICGDRERRPRIQINKTIFEMSALAFCSRCMTGLDVDGLLTVLTTVVTSDS